MKIGIIKETKEPQDNRVALTPEEIVKLQNTYPEAHFVVQRSNIRSYSDEEYEKLGISVVDDVADCDILFGIKEADRDTLLPKKHYFFFGHIAKMQPYNRPLLKQMMKLGITFSDYEYLVDEKGERVCAFGWWAGQMAQQGRREKFSGRRKNKTGGTSILFRAGFWLRSGMGSCLASVCMVKMSLFSSFNKINVAYLSVK